MKITRAEIVRLRGSPDHVFLHTDIVGPFPQYPELLVLKFEAPQGEGEAYLEANFPDVSLEKVIDVRNVPNLFSKE